MIEASEICKLLRYEPETGKLFWKPRGIELFKDERSWKIWNTRYANQEAFTAVSDRGQKSGAIFGVNYTAHRVAWAVHHGEWPKETIDHINGNPSDNRLCNLREATKLEQGKNMPLNSTNTSGVIGVYKHSAANVWIARINLNGVMRHIGSFKLFKDAVKARKIAEILAGYHPNHGRQAAI